MPPEPRFVSLTTKLALATLALLLFVTAAVQLGLSRFEREKSIAAKEQAARMSGDLFLRSVSTPVFFDDAKGIEDSAALLVQDPEVLGVQLWKADGEGQAGDPLAERLKPGQASVVGKSAIEPFFERASDRVVLRGAIRDPEGHVIAVAAVQYSLARENAAFTALSRRILGVAAGVAGFLLLLLWAVMRRWVIGPLARLLTAVKQVESGARIAIEQSASNDEVGRLAAAFGRMVSAVAEREQDIARRNADLRLVLDNVGEGFVVIDTEGRMALGRSAIVDRWFGAPRPAEMITDYLRPVDPEGASMLEVGLEALREGFMPVEVTLDQLPRRIQRHGRSYECEYRPVLAGDEVKTLVLVISDVTGEVERQRAEQAQRDILAAVSRIVADRHGYLDFQQEAGALHERLTGDGAETLSLAETMRDLHTMKGICALFGLHGLASLCHEIEDRCLRSGGELPDREQRASLAERWLTINAAVAPFAGTDRKTIDLTLPEYSALLAAVEEGRPHRQLLETLRAWRDPPVLPRLERLGEYATALARRLDRCPVVVDHGGDEVVGLRLPREPWDRLWPCLSHLVANAVDHGLETEEERIDMGKSVTALLVISAHVDGDAVELEFADDGRGIDWQALARKAESLGLPATTHDDLVAALFADGISTREAATSTSGRGVGLAAVRAQVEALGGSIFVESSAGRGTRFLLRLPRAQHRSSERLAS